MPLLRNNLAAALRCRRIAFLLLFFALLASLYACSTPQQRYKTLSFFFDGVPNPDAPKRVRGTVTTGPAFSTVITASIVSHHKPFMESKCDSCHRSAAGNMLEFSEAYKGCTACHKGIPNSLPLMHGPVARGGCDWCHTGHESRYPALLKDDPVKVCTQCHDARLLGPIPLQHFDGRTSCIECHYGHGGKAQNFLKPYATPEWPASRPATQPTTRPTTAPVLELKPQTSKPDAQGANP